MNIYYKIIKTLTRCPVCNNSWQILKTLFFNITIIFIYTYMLTNIHFSKSDSRLRSNFTGRSPLANLKISLVKFHNEHTSIFLYIDYKIIYEINFSYM